MPPAREFLLRGLLAGLIAGIAAFGVAYLIGEPALNAAIAAEHANADPGHQHPPGEEHADGLEVSRPVQATLGLLTGTVLTATTLGGFAGVLTALAIGRFGTLGPRATALLLTGIGFLSLSFVPYLGYPPNPPGAASPDTIGNRTAGYLILIAIALLAAVAAVLLARRQAAAWGPWYATLAAVGAYLVLIVLALALLPRHDEVSVGFPAGVLYDFRIASLLTQLTLWAVLGVALAELVGRLVEAPSRRRPVPADGSTR